MGLKDTSGAGGLQHHIRMLSQNVNGEKSKVEYHVMKRHPYSLACMFEELETDGLDFCFFSLITNHPFDTDCGVMPKFFPPKIQQSLSSPTSFSSAAQCVSVSAVVSLRHCLLMGYKTHILLLCQMGSTVKSKNM